MESSSTGPAPTLADLGEDAVLARIIARITPAANLTVGPGDDGSVSALPGPVVLSSDMLVEDQDFTAAWFDPYKLGIKAAAQNLADIYAMGATPHGLLLNIAAPATTPISDLEDLTQGLVDEAGRADCGLIGGDLSAGSELVISVTAVGYLPAAEVPGSTSAHSASAGNAAPRPLLRSGARPGDTVFLAGTLGRAAAGLDLLFAGHRPAQGPTAELADLIETQLAPRPDYEAAGRLPGWASAAIDASDGLVGDLGKVAAASGVDVDLDAGDLDAIAAPLLPAARALGAEDPAARARHWVLTGGEDHGFIVAGPAASAPVGLKRLGVCTPGTGKLRLDGRSLAEHAFTHFS